jgi:hypothetical protein
LVDLDSKPTGSSLQRDDNYHASVPLLDDEEVVIKRVEFGQEGEK